MKYLAILLFALLLTGCVVHTADPALSFFVPIAPPPPGAPIAPAIVPDPTAVAIEEEEEPQVACEIKANVGSSGNIYHLPGGVYYDRVKVDISQGDFWACTEQEAIDAGFRKSSR